MPKKKKASKKVVKPKKAKKDAALEPVEERELEDEFEGDTGEEVDEVGAEPVYSKEDDEL